MTWALVTGATSGIGRDAAFRLAAAGMRVIATGRSAEKLVRLEREARERGLTITTVELDVCDADSVARAKVRVDAITGGHGLDVLVNNAGYGEMGPLELFDEARVRSMFETNVLGAARVTRAFVPAMREQRSGRVVNVSSVLGRMTIAAHAPYGATKHALEALSDALRIELAPFGVSVVVIEPGSIDTGFSDIAFGQIDGFAQHAEWSALAANLRRFETWNARISAKPEVVSRAIIEAATRAHPPARIVVPSMAKAQLLAARLTPRSIYEAVLSRAMGLTVRGHRAAREGDKKKALITGAAGGIGTATALRLAKLGLSVVATDVDEMALARLTRDARASGLAISTLAMDVTDAKSIAHAAERVGPLDVLINNAGYAELGPIELVGDDAWRAQLEVNVYGPLAVTRAFLPALRHSRGRIINVSSVAGVVSMPFMGVYCASKFALEALSDALRIELAMYGIDVSVVQPAFIRSGFAQRAKQTVERYALSAGPYAAVGERMETILARLDGLGGEPSDVAKQIALAATRKRPKARYRAPFSAALLAPSVPFTPRRILDAALSRMFETTRLTAVQTAARARASRSPTG